MDKPRVPVLVLTPHKRLCLSHNAVKRKRRRQGHRNWEGKADIIPQPQGSRAIRHLTLKGQWDEEIRDKEELRQDESPETPVGPAIPCHVTHRDTVQQWGV